MQPTAMRLPPFAQAGLWMAAVVCLAASLFTNYWLDRLLARQPFRWRDMAIQCTLMAVEPVLVRITGFNLAVNTIGMIVLPFLISGWAFRQRGVSLVWVALKIIASLLALEVICAGLMLPFVPLGLPTQDISIRTLSDFLNPYKSVCMYGFGAVGHLVAIGLLCLWRWLRGLARRHAIGWLYVKVYLRMSLLVALGSGAMYTAATVWGSQLYLKQGKDFIASNARYVPQVLLAAGLLVVAVSYFAQDVNYIDQLRRHETLEKQHALANSMLTNLRYFRHNMMNMLYGLEGVMLSGNTQDLQAYYQEMTRRCALVNNENIIALQRIDDPALSALLLRIIDQAREKQLPISLYVQEGLTPAHGLSRGDTCQILGVLLDNALEAAAQSTEPFIWIELRRVDGMMEAIIKNTYAGTVDAALLSRGGRSTKPGHMGQGLASCYDILERKSGAFINFDVSGQYVRAQLLIKL